MPHEIAVDDLGSIGGQFEESARHYGERTAFVSGAAGVGLTYREVDTLSRHVAAYLQSVLWLARGSRVALMLPNLLQFPVCLLGFPKRQLACFVVRRVKRMVPPFRLPGAVSLDAMLA